MRVGIHTHYAHCDQTYFAVRLAQLLHKLGIEFDIYSENSPGKLGIPYDRAVITRSIVRFTDWAKKQKIIVWTNVPRAEQISYAKRRGIKTILVPMWQELIPPYKKAMQAADVVISQCAESQALFSEIYKIKSTQLIPFDTGLPITKKNALIDERNIKLFLPWFDRNARCSGGQFIAIIRYLMERMPEAHLTVAITPSRFSPSIAKFFLNMRKTCGDRIILKRSVPYLNRPQLYSTHDLTVFPAECDNFGLCALTSITMGTPVVSTAISPQIDFLYPDNNAILISTKLDYDENGVVHALPDYEKFGYALQSLIAEPRQIQKLNGKTNYNLHSRRKSFEMSWTNLFDG